MRKVYYLFVLTCMFFLNSFGQSVLDPNDPVITYNPASPPAQPAFGTIGKWVRTKRLTWNTDEYKCYIYKGSPFRLHFPKTYNPSANDGKKYPVLVFFHGLGEGDTSIYDNEYQLYHGGDVFQNAVDNGTFDGYIFEMQTESFWGDDQYQYISEILDYMIANNKADPFAIVANGLSAGGQGAWEMMFTHPTYIAANVPMSFMSSYYADEDTINKIKFTPIWYSQGGLDGSPAPYTAHLVRDAMLNAGANLTYIEFSTQGHDTWDSTWLLPEFFPYLLQAYSSNPWTLYGKTKFCPGDSINVTMGLAPGFEAYQWRRNGNIISGATSRSINVTQTGTYDARVKRNGIWSEWSRKPAKIIIQKPAETPPIQVTGLMSSVLPATDGKNYVTLKVSGNNTYTSYTWKKVGSDSVYSTSAIFTATEAGYYKVNALPQSSCASLHSPYFKVINAKGPNAPNAVKSLTASPTSNTKILLEWNPFKEQTNPPVGFEVYRGTSSGTYSLIALLKPSITSFQDTGLTPKIRYYYVVRAFDSTGAAPLSTEVSSLTYSDTTAPSIPPNLHTTFTTPSTISVAWWPSTDNVAVDHYNIYINDKLTYVTSETSAVLTSLTQNNVYDIYVKAVDGSGNISGVSNQISAEPILGGLKYSYYKTPVQWLQLPDFSTLTPHKTGVSKNVDIEVVNQNVLNGFLWQGYIRIPVSGTYTIKTTSSDGSALWFNSYTPTGTPLVNNDGKHDSRSRKGIIKINAGTYPICIEYFHNNKTVGKMAVSWSCPELFGDTLQRSIADSFFNADYVNKGTIPAMPGNTVATAKTYNKINITWNDNSSNETSFEIYRSTGGGAFKIIATVAANTTSFNDSALSSSKKYYYAIQAINHYGNSGLSKQDSAVTLPLPAPPNTPDNFKATAASSSKITLSWNSVTNATGYQLLRSIDDSLRYRLLTTFSKDIVSYKDSDLGAHLVYYYKLKAIGTGETLSSAAVSSATTQNNAPVISQLKTIKAGYGITTKIPLTATDANGDLLDFKKQRLPSFASIHDYGNDSASLVIKPLQQNLGTHDNLKIIVTDPYGGVDSTIFKIIVNNNSAPTIDPITDYTLNENDSINIALTAHDDNSEDVLSWSVLNAPQSFKLISNNRQATLTLHPNYLAAGTYTVTVSVNDGKGGISTRNFNVIVKDVNPNTNIYVRFEDTDAVGKPWNSITGLSANNFIDASGKKTSIGLSFQTSWFATYNAGPTTGDNSGIYPDAVLQDYYYFGILDAPETVDTKITGLDPSTTYNFTFYAGSNFYGAADNGSTIFTIGNKSDTLAVQNNTTKTVTISNVKPAPDGSVVYTMSKDTDAIAGYLNALVISSLYDDGTTPVKPASLSAQNNGKGVQLLWSDVAYNEAGYKIYRSLSTNENFTVIGETQSEATSYVDTTATGNAEYLYKIAAFNAHGNSNYSNTVTITTLNHVPKLNAISNVILNYINTSTIHIKATDDNNDHITLSALDLPTFAKLTDNGDGTGKIVVTPAVNNTGSFKITVIATDKSKASDSTTFTILVKDPNISSTYLSFSDGAEELPSPWNLIGPYPSAGASFKNLKDDGNNPSAITLTLKNGFQGVNESGMKPTEGAGIYPDAVMRSAVFEGTNNPDTIQLSGLSKAKAYNFVFFNSYDVGLNGTTKFSIGKKAAYLNATGNINKAVQLNGIIPDATGIINIVVSKASAADYGFLTSLIIESFDTAYKYVAPTNLRVNNITRNSISILWQDEASSETAYQIWRAKDGEKNYTLLTTVSPGVRSYTDKDLVKNKKYSYAVRAVFGNEYSNYSNTVSATTYAYNVYLNFTSANITLLPWNNLNAVPQLGYTWNNFFDEKGMITGTGMQLNTTWAGMFTLGMNSDTGIFPNTVMGDGYVLFPGQKATFTITGLNIHMKYDFTFFASSQAGGDVNAAYTINGVTTTLNAALNINTTQTIYKASPDKNGTITISVEPTPGSQYGLVSALIMGAYSPSSADIPKLPETPGFTFEKSETVIASTIKQKDDNDITAFPNPFHNYVMVQLPSVSISGNLQVMMYDIKGNLVYKKEYANAQQKKSIQIITDNNLAAGVYTVVVVNTDTDETKTIKLIKR